MAEKVSREKVEAALGEIRKVLQRDGGDLELVDITEDNQVQVKLQGHCVGCPGAQMTLNMLCSRFCRKRFRR